MKLAHCLQLPRVGGELPVRQGAVGAVGHVPQEGHRGGVLGRAAAAFRFLIDKNRYYKALVELQHERIRNHAPLAISSYDLFIVLQGVECGMFPVLYPTDEFTDTST